MFTSLQTILTIGLSMWASLVIFLAAPAPTTQRRALSKSDLILLQLDRLQSEQDSLRFDLDRAARLKRYHINSPMDNPIPDRAERKLLEIILEEED